MKSFEQVRAEFPALTQKVNGKPLVYLDSAASALKPQSVVDTLTNFYAYEASNVHRGVHSLSAAATSRFEAARATVQEFIHAREECEIIFTKGTTESVNLIAHSWGRQNIQKGDVILLSEMEHHSNIVPWQMLAEEKEAIVKFVNVTENGVLDLDHLDSLLADGAKILAVAHCSNTLGTINDVKTMVAQAHAAGVLVAVDGAQSITGMPVDVQDLDCDFFSFSGHKLFGPYGIGVLYGKKEILESMPPYQGGGSMIDKVTTSAVTFNDIPFRFEAGTPHIAGVIGLAAAIDYLNGIGMERIFAYEKELVEVAFEQLESVPDLKMIGQERERLPIFSFIIEGLHGNDIGEILDQDGVAVRTGHHCTQPLMQKYNLSATVRASFSIYNNVEDIECLRKSLIKSKELLG